MPQNIQSTINLTIKTSERVFGDSLFDGNYTFEKEVIGHIYIYVACTLYIIVTCTGVLSTRVYLSTGSTYSSTRSTVLLLVNGTQYYLMETPVLEYSSNGIFWETPVEYSQY